MTDFDDISSWPWWKFYPPMRHKNRRKASLGAVESRLDAGDWCMMIDLGKPKTSRKGKRLRRKKMRHQLDKGLI